MRVIFSILFAFASLVTSMLSHAQDSIVQTTLSTLKTQASTNIRSNLKYAGLNLPKNSDPIVLRSTQQSCMGSSDQVIIRNDQTLGPVRDQDTVGWCFGYSSAELLTLQTGTKVSAADIAINSLYDSNVISGPKASSNGKPKIGDFEIQSLKAGIHPLEVLENSGGYCPEAVMRSDDSAIPESYLAIKAELEKDPDYQKFAKAIIDLETEIIKDKTWLNIDFPKIIKNNKNPKYIPDIYEMKKVAEETMVSRQNSLAKLSLSKESYINSWIKSKRQIYDLLSQIESIKDEFEEKQFEPSVCRKLENVLVIFPHLDYATVLGAVKESKDSKDFILWLQRISCKDHRQKFSNDFKLFGDWSPKAARNMGKSFFATIDEQLKKGNIVETTYYSMFMSSEFIINQKRDALKKSGSDPESYKDYLHASVIVGKRFNQGKCQYLIRNSWGTGCGFYNLNRVQCEAGNLWVDETDLNENMVGMTYLEKI